MNGDGLSFDEAYSKADINDMSKEDVIKIYSIMSEVLDSYEE